MESPNWTFFTHPDANNNADFDVLTKATRESFALVERWKENRSLQNHEPVDSVITRIITQTTLYYLVIKISVQTADEGLTFTKQAGELCKRLVQVNDAPERLDENLKQMYDLVEKAHCGSLVVNERFRTVRTNMFEIMRAIPTYVDEILPAKQVPDNTTSSGHIPLEVLAQLQSISGDMELLIRNTSVFVDWWANVKQNFKHLESVIPQIKSDRSNLFRTESVSQSWNDIRQEYGSYISRMTEIQDFYLALLSPSAKAEIKAKVLEEEIYQETV